MDHHHKSLKQELLAQALKNIADKGVEDFSLREVAKQLNISQTSPYRHFLSKELLIKNLLIQGYNILIGLLEHALAVGTDPAKKLQALGIAYINFFLNNRAYFSLMYEHNILDAHMAAEIAPYRACAYGLLKTFIAENMASGFFRPGDPDHTAFSSWAYLHGLVVLWHKRDASSPQEVREEEIQKYIKLFMNGVILNT